MLILFLNEKFEDMVHMLKIELKLVLYGISKIMDTLTDSKHIGAYDDVDDIWPANRVRLDRFH